MKWGRDFIGFHGVIERGFDAAGEDVATVLNCLFLTVRKTRTADPAILV